MADNYSSNPNTSLEIGEFSILMNEQCVDCRFKDLVLEKSSVKNLTETVNVYKIRCNHAEVCKHFTKNK